MLYDFEDKILSEIAAERKLADTRERDAYIRGMKRALEVTAGRERAEVALASIDESF